MLYPCSLLLQTRKTLLFKEKACLSGCRSRLSLMALWRGSNNLLPTTYQITCYMLWTKSILKNDQNLRYNFYIDNQVIREYLSRNQIQKAETCKLKCYFKNIKRNATIKENIKILYICGLLDQTKILNLYLRRKKNLY